MDREEIRKKMEERLKQQQDPSEGLSPDVAIMVEKNPALSSYVTPEHNAAQAMVIEEGLAAGVDVTKYNDPRYNYAQMNAVLEGLKQGIDPTPYVDFRRNDLIIREVVRAIRDGLTRDQIRIVQRQYNWKQAMEVRLGFKHGVDAYQYANPQKYTSNQMYQMRKELEDQEG